MEDREWMKDANAASSRTLLIPTPPTITMAASAPNAELLRSLGRLVRGLSALFWGLPATLVVCVGTAGAGWFRSFGVLPALAVTSLLLFGLWQLGSFQKQERPWRSALERTRLLALINVGLSPFLFWSSRVPDQPFFRVAVFALAICGVLFLFNLNIVIARLGAMLPDETLRQETSQFTTVNRGLFAGILTLTAAYFFLSLVPNLPPAIMDLMEIFGRASGWSLVFLSLLPLSLTMALIWKTKEVILASVFDERH